MSNSQSAAQAASLQTEVESAKQTAHAATEARGQPKHSSFDKIINTNFIFSNHFKKKVEAEKN